MKRIFSYVCGDVGVVRGVVPDDLSLPSPTLFPLFCWCACGFFVGKCVVEAAVF